MWLTSPPLAFAVRVATRHVLLHNDLLESEIEIGASNAVSNMAMFLWCWGCFFREWARL